MSFRETPLAAGIHFVATPIGNARDITLRALDVLASADVIAAEDTRTARHLMDIHGIPVKGRPMIPYHDHNGAQARPRLLALAEEGKSVAYASEAGMPLVADPGFQLGREAIARGIPVTGVPGASAPLAALTISGLPSDRFLFAGFPPAAGGARRSWIKGLAEVEATLILFESPKRVNRLLGELCEGLGGERQAAICRELTKKFEEALRGTLSELVARLDGVALKGEIVVVIDRPGTVEVDPGDLDAAIRLARQDLRVKDAAAQVADRFGLPRRDVYQRALELDRNDAGE
ncbi:16S rRNA (cytidine(1402)-2'-O)-methyltransferase [Pacificitalea manganoxidans]|uniref:Ribosomal RNA small subunit methyltransferase I n=1 Tax=Pacificitalea manganoxidans TaxID=1411902 RepID=A0A291M3B0_9RHOB|nr:16S rRNA (cytidine(1402)-2'-O)-methyltransferase [Pacificitalea manganoxidans]ATI43483.1 16S rRNA (cytidine(1402)-2'-O)-methyltransferase [Pacificitalea manganoxidans]MDR6307011.1 16S rRNA (cytidine1402-2'-O)-methyltransferase [Pacificitalea manganoxidans]OWU70303.1 16S rRNA methyltransferase [Roseovarius sp. 22II1-1F6A]